MHDPRPPYLEGHHPHHHCGLHNDNLPHIHNPNSHPDGLDCHHHHHDPSCGCHDHLPPDLHCLDVIPRFRFHEKDGETRGFHRTNVAYRDIILSALKNYPKLDEPQVAKAMWAFCKDIILRDEHGCCGVPVSEIDGESTHNICFTDHCGHELSKIQFYRTSNEAGVRIGVGEYSFGIRSFNGLAPETWTLYPSNPNSAQIARCDWVLDKMEDLLQEFLQNADDIPTQGSNNVVKSGGVYSWVLGLINQEIAERLAGDANLQNQVNELKQRKNYDMHDYPHAGHTTQVVSCDGIYKYGQDILAAAKSYCDGNHSGDGSDDSGSSGGGFAGLVWAYNKSSLNKDGSGYISGIPGNVTNIAIGEIVTGDKLAKSFDIGEGGAVGGDVLGNGESGVISAENSNGSGHTTLYHCGYDISNIVTLDPNKKYRAIYAPSHETTTGSPGTTTGGSDTRPFARWVPGFFAVVGTSSGGMQIRAYPTCEVNSGSSIGVGEIVSSSRLCINPPNNSAVTSDMTIQGYWKCLEAASISIGVPGSSSNIVISKHAGLFEYLGTEDPNA